MDPAASSGVIAPTAFTLYPGANHLCRMQESTGDTSLQGPMLPKRASVQTAAPRCRSAAASAWMEPLLTSIGTNGGRENTAPGDTDQREQPRTSAYSKGVLTVVEQASQDPEPRRRHSIPILVAVLAAILIALWLLVRPGVFTIQPIGALPEGVTVIYHSRNPDMPFFSSPDGLCLRNQGSVNLLCRAAGIGAMEELEDRILLRLPYSRWAYLRSTGGREFDR